MFLLPKLSKKNISKIFRPVFASLSVNGLNDFIDLSQIPQ